MARYKFVDMSPRLLPVDLEAQLVPGTFAHAVHHLVDALDLSAFDAHYRNDENGAPAHAPAMLLKAVLLAYSQGIVSSRAIERACRDNVLFIAITDDAKPHFTTIADFISRSRDAIASVFAQVLTVLVLTLVENRPRNRGLARFKLTLRRVPLMSPGARLQAECPWSFYGEPRWSVLSEHQQMAAGTGSPYNGIAGRPGDAARDVATVFPWTPIPARNGN